MNPQPAGRRPEPRPERSPFERLSAPRNLVFVVLFAVVGVGGGRRMLQAWRARRAIARLDDPGVSPTEVEQVGRFGRAGAYPLFHILSDDARPDHRDAAARALLRIWTADELVAEEEQAIVRRLYHVRWEARRTYPRALKRPIPIGLFAGIREFLPDESERTRGGKLLQSYRVTGTGRASFEEDSPWQPGVIDTRVTIDPDDFPTDGPHRLVLQARIRTGPHLNGDWEIELPHSAFRFEFDRRLQVDSLLTHLDESRRAAMESGLAFSPDAITSIDLGDRYKLTDVPELRVAAGLPCDIAHRVEFEFEGYPGLHPARPLVVSGERGGTYWVPEMDAPSGADLRPGEIRLRAILTADAELGWTDPAIRSIWPGAITTGWVAARVLRK